MQAKHGGAGWALRPREALMTTRIGINGFGRIGRLVFRACLGRDDLTALERIIGQLEGHVG
jgi:lactate dehydrogenase-like 2-hydroxyacid dehydrogenase